MARGTLGFTQSSLLIDPERPFIDRDLSWLQFNGRVLAEGQDPSVPLLERLRFLGISSSNLDEFFMIRFASLSRELINLGRSTKVKRGSIKRLRSVRAEMLKAITVFSAQQTKILGDLEKDLARADITMVRGLPKQAWAYRLAREVFYHEVLPHLERPKYFTLQEVRRLLNLQIALVFSDHMLLPIPRSLEHVFWRRLSKKRIAVFFLDDLLLTFAGQAFGETSSPLMIRITRDCDVRVDLDQEDPAAVPDIVREKIKSRETRKSVRLQLRGNVSMPQVQDIADTLRLPREQVFRVEHPLLLHGAFRLVNYLGEALSDRPTLFYPAFKPVVPKAFTKAKNVFAEIRKHDHLIHHPYDSFVAYENFIAAAADDPDVESIQQTVYRVDAVSRVTQMLKRAAKTKKVRVVIEPRARFDEINNIALAEELREAGVDVVFATGKLKMHAKIALVVRKEGGRRESFTHLSTGNYNAVTARVYTDLAVVTADREIGKDAEIFFKSVRKGVMPEGLTKLVLAPTGLHRKVIALIKAETAAAKKGKDARIMAKVNALVDPKVVEMLYEASQAGVKIDLQVRGACSLVPGVVGLSDNVRVISVVDRFLEHSRIYYFQHCNQMFLSSADWMPRNFFSRLEIAFPVLDPRIFQFISETLLPVGLNDREKGRMLTRLGIWRSRPSVKEQAHPRSQEFFKELAENRYKGTSLE